MKTNVIEIITAEDYLAFERNAQQKHEFYNGIIIEMPGASSVHKDATYNIGFFLGLHAFLDNFKIRIADERVQTKDAFFYPDVVALKLPDIYRDAEKDTLLNPCVIFEVLSPSTEKFDRNEKFTAYTQIEFLTDYILVAQNKIQVERFSRTENDVWERQIFTSPEDRLEFEFSFISLREIYHRTGL